MRIFFVCRRVPFPPDRGDKIATFNEIRHLSARHEVHVFCLADSARDLDNIAGLADYTSSVTAFPVEPARIKLRALMALPTSRPLSVAALDEAKLHAAIRRKFNELQPDLIIVYSCNVAQFAEHFPTVPRIMQFGDLDLLKWRQYAERSRIPLKLVYASEGRRLLAYERRIAKAFSALRCVHAEGERRDFERLIPGDRSPSSATGSISIISAPAGLRSAGFDRVYGVMDYRPNIDAVEWFCEEVLPAVRAAVPKANLTICGSSPRPPWSAWQNAAA